MFPYKCNAWLVIRERYNNNHNKKKPKDILQKKSTKLF